MCATHTGSCTRYSAVSRGVLCYAVGLGSISSRGVRCRGISPWPALEVSEGRLLCGASSVPRTLLTITYTEGIRRMLQVFPGEVFHARKRHALTVRIEAAARDDLLRIGQFFGEFRAALQCNAYRKNVADREMRSA